MSSLIVEVCRIDDIQPHDNADKLEIATVKGWQCIISKDKYKKGDKIVYIPIDSMIPFELSERLGITKYLKNQEKDDDGNITYSRVKTIRLRGVLSQGLIIDIQDPLPDSWKVGDNVKERLGIKKYVPKVSKCSNLIHTYPGWRLPEYPEFVVYTDIENYKNYPYIIKEGEEVIINEKIHGTSTRVARLPIELSYFPMPQKITLSLKKIGNIITFGLYKPSVFLVGSHNCNIKRLSKREQNKDMGIYWKISLKYELDKKLKEGEEIFGEIYGRGIQEYLEYDGTEEVKVRFFDIRSRNENGIMKYLDWDLFSRRCRELDLPIVPILYRGPFYPKLLSDFIRWDKSVIGNHLKEGCVIRPTKERFHPKLGRVILKYINSEYLLLKQEKEKENKRIELDIFDH